MSEPPERPNPDDDNETPDPYIPSDSDEEEETESEEQIVERFSAYLRERSFDQDDFIVSNCNTCAHKPSCQQRRPISSLNLIEEHPMRREESRIGETDVVHGGIHHCANWSLLDIRWRVFRHFIQAMEDVHENPNEASFYTRGRGENRQTIFVRINTILENAINMEMAIRILRGNRDPDGNQWNFRRPETRDMVIAQAIFRDLTFMGKFIHDDQGLYYYFNKEERHVIPMFNSKNERREIYGSFASYIQDKYGVYDKIAGLFRWLISKATLNCEHQTVQKFTHMRIDPPTLYIYDRDRSIFKLTGTRIQKILNGEEIFFRTEPNHKEIIYIPPEEREDPTFNIQGILYPGIDDPILNFFINRTNYTLGSYLTAKEQLMQAALQFYILPFRDFLQTKPIMRFVGSMGSCKTFTAKTWMKFLINFDYEVSDSAFPKRDDFLVTLSHSPYFVIDNLDKDISYMENTLAAVATGAVTHRRELYTTGDLHTTKPDCFVFITSRSATCKREDLSDRSLIFHTRRLNDFISERSLLQPLESHRNYFWSVFLDQLNSIIYDMRTNGFEEMTTGHRIADWVILATVINRTLRLDERYEIDFNMFLESVNKERAAFTLADEPILEYTRYIYENFARETLSASQLEEHFKTHNPDSDFSTQQIAKVLNKYELVFRELFNMQITYDRAAKRKLYTFGLRDRPTTRPLDLQSYLTRPEQTEEEEEEPEEEEERPTTPDDISLARLNISDTVRDVVNQYTEEHDDDPMPIEELIAFLVEQLHYTRVEAVRIIDEATRRGVLFEPQQGFMRVP